MRQEKGPAWSNSLFEDNAEFGYGMLLAQNAIREGIRTKIEDIVENGQNEDVKAAGKEWLETYSCGAANGAATDKLIAALEACGCDTSKELLKKKDFMAKKSQWIFGGDGWAYDIGFGGVDHVLASGKDINVMVFDTEVYSNTGGQASKSTPTGAIAQFAAGGKDVKKKRYGEHCNELWLCICSTDLHGSRLQSDCKSDCRSRSIPGTIPDHRLCSMYQPWY